jgi:two-component system, OmpR family, response regulator VicR
VHLRSNAKHPMTTAPREEIQRTARVLFADDEADARHLLQASLEPANIQVHLVENGLQALLKWQDIRFDMLILDVMMPEMDGLEVCRRIRRTSNIPIILLTAHGRERDIVAGFDCGADDYVIKPYRAIELVARIQAILKRTAPPPLVPARWNDDIYLDHEAQRIVCRGRRIKVTPLEFRLMLYLMQNPGETITKSKLLQNVWGYLESGSEMNLIETAIHRLRNKIEPNPSRPKYIHTVWGAGYRFGE